MHLRLRLVGLLRLAFSIATVILITAELCDDRVGRDLQEAVDAYDIVKLQLLYGHGAHYAE